MQYVSAIEVLSCIAHSLVAKMSFDEILPRSLTAIFFKLFSHNNVLTRWQTKGRPVAENNKRKNG